MKVSANKIVEVPETVVEQQKEFTGTYAATGAVRRSANPGCGPHASRCAACPSSRGGRFGDATQDR